MIGDCLEIIKEKMRRVGSFNINSPSRINDRKGLLKTDLSLRET